MCSVVLHEDAPCRYPVCINCGSHNPSNSKNCEVFVVEKEIISLQAGQHIVFAAALERVNATRTHVGHSSGVNYTSAASISLNWSPRQPDQSVMVPPGLLGGRQGHPRCISAGSHWAGSVGSTSGRGRALMKAQSNCSHPRKHSTGTRRSPIKSNTSN